MKAAQILAEKEKEMLGNTFVVRDLEQPPLEWEVQPRDKRAALSAAAKSGVLLTLTDYGRFQGWAETRVKAAAEQLPGIFLRLGSDGRAESAIRESRLQFEEPSQRMQEHVQDKLAANYSLASRHRNRRSLVSTLRGEETKKVAVQQVLDTTTDDCDAAEYALYKIACFAEYNDTSILTPDSVVLQNHARA